MSKIFIAVCLSVVLLLGAGVNVFAATTEAVPVSGESASDFGGNATDGTAVPNSNNQTAGSTGTSNSNGQAAGNTSSATEGSSAAQSTDNQAAATQENSGTAAPRVTTTIDNSEAIVEENRTKNNAMMEKKLYEGRGISRYSDQRVALAPDIADTKYAEAARILGALGIMVGDAE
ncbi:MAG: hypothetical protein Q4A86_04340, partial [Clostridia bacterium]|nr:hypothetical protein [Clostridia bacterium]